MARLNKIFILTIALFSLFCFNGFAFAAECVLDGSSYVCCSNFGASGKCGAGAANINDASDNYYIQENRGTLNSLTAADVTKYGSMAKNFIAPISPAAQAVLTSSSASPGGLAPGTSSSASSGAPGGTTGAAVTLSSPIKCGGVDCDLKGIINGIMNFVFTIALVICPIFIVWGGFEIATAAGSEEKVKHGREIITYALVGLVIIAASKGLVAAIQSVL